MTKLTTDTGMSIQPVRIYPAGTDRDEFGRPVLACIEAASSPRTPPRHSDGRMPLPVGQHGSAALFANDGRAVLPISLNTAEPADGEPLQPVRFYSLTTGAPDDYSAYRLVFDAKAGRYRQGSVSGSNPATVFAGWTYTRAVAKAEFLSSTALTSFAPNVPGIVPGVGYFARGAVSVINSNVLTPAWSPLAGASIAGTVEQSVGASTLINLPASGDSAVIAAVNAIAATDKRTVAVMIRGTPGEQVYVQCARDGAGVFEVESKPVILTAAFQWVWISRTFVNAQTGFRIQIIRSGTVGWASQVEVWLPHLYGSEVHNPPLSLAGTASIGADAASFTEAKPAGAFTLLAKVTTTGDVQSNRRLFCWSDGTVNNVIRIFMSSTVNGVNFQVMNAGVSVPLTGDAGGSAIRTVTLALRWNGASWRGFINGAAVGSEQVAAVPPGTQFDIGHQLGGLQLQDALPILKLREGNLTDAEVIAEMALL